MVLATLLFYIFAGMLLLSATLVVTARNPVYAVLFLILAFFNSAGLFILLGAEFIAMLMVIVYVGAVAVLFLFVVMMLNINLEELRQGFKRFLPIGLLVAGIIAAELILTLYASASRLNATTMKLAIPEKTTNTHQLGHILYTDYALAFQLAGLVLLVAMIGAITLTLRQRAGVRRQKIGAQLSRKPEEGVRIVKVEPGQGI